MKIRPLQTGFSTTDASLPELHLVGGSLHLIFKNWQDKAVQVHLDDVIAFNWQSDEIQADGDPMDDTWEVIDSLWLALHVQAGVIPLAADYRHLCFHFNACGQLEVICREFREVS